jgi:hypothetical protein
MIIVLICIYLPIKRHIELPSERIIRARLGVFDELVLREIETFSSGMTRKSRR